MASSPTANTERENQAPLSHHVTTVSPDGSQLMQGGLVTLSEYMHLCTSLSRPSISSAQRTALGVTCAHPFLHLKASRKFYAILFPS